MRFPLLLDAYGALLTERKRELLDYYYNEDYSLSEIAELTGLSRQGARDGIRKAEEELRTLEDTLSMVRLTETVAEIAEKEENTLSYLDLMPLYLRAPSAERNRRLMEAQHD